MGSAKGKRSCAARAARCNEGAACRDDRPSRHIIKFHDNIHRVRNHGQLLLLLQFLHHIDSRRTDVQHDRISVIHQAGGQGCNLLLLCHTLVLAYIKWKAKDVLLIQNRAATLNCKPVILKFLQITAYRLFRHLIKLA